MEIELQQVAEVVQRAVKAPRQTGVSIRADAERRRAFFAELRKVAEGAPLVAMLRAFEAIEERVRRLLAATESSIPSRAASLAALAMENGYISPATLQAIEGLAGLRNLAAHDVRTPNSEDAFEFLKLAETVLFAIDMDEANRKGRAAS